MRNLEPNNGDIEPVDPEAPFGPRLDSVISTARDQLIALQAEDGHWSFELEADATIPSEYILLNHFLGDPNDEVEGKISNYLRRIQNAEGGWPLYQGGASNISATVKAYFALKLVGDDIDAPHMTRARKTVLAGGGLAECNVFTRYTLAMFNIVPWRAVPVSPVEILLAPRWFPIQIGKVSYWSRTVTVPLLVLTALRADAENPRNIGLDELQSDDRDRAYYALKNPTGHWLGGLMIRIDKLARQIEPFIPKRWTQRAIDRALVFIDERLNGEDGLGGIFPAMANALMVFHTLGYDKDDPKVITARKAIDRLLVFSGDEAYCQPCLSPVWDTGLALHALLETEPPENDLHIAKATDWLLERQISDLRGDWAVMRPDAQPGGWAFQYRNDYYPDVDDTAVVVMGLDRIKRPETDPAIKRATDWVLGMQSKNGGWAAFDADNTYHLLEHVPFADHGALLDPPTSDVSARCLSMLAQLGYDKSHPAIRRGVGYLCSEQEEDGSWFGRWGTNYIYGTWSALCALNVAGDEQEGAGIARAADWLEGQQNEDGGWGEDCATYWDGEGKDFGISLPSQTAWAILGLMAAGRGHGSAVRRGIEHLLSNFDPENGWYEEYYNAVGFPRVFYLKYHGYRSYFPLLALSRYRNIEARDDGRIDFGF
ncbi:MAG: squalene--hopene cyclase [Rhodospirillales bacterium]|nr:squalene--hopene cyclase [Rhodospirillales bacterium]